MPCLLGVTTRVSLSSFHRRIKNARSVARTRRVKVEFGVGYTLFGFKLVFAHAFKYPAVPDDKARILEYVTKYMPRVLETWKTGEGSDILGPSV